MAHNGKRFVVILIALAFRAVATEGSQASVKEIDHDRIAKIGKAHGITVRYSYSPNGYFSERAMRAPMRAKGSQMSPEHIERLLPGVERFVSRYGRGVLEGTLSHIFLTGNLEVCGQERDSWIWHTRLYVGNLSMSRGYSDSHLEGYMHRDFSRMLVSHYSHLFPVRQWQAANEAGWQYAIVQGEPGDLEEKPYSRSDDLLERGFLVNYSQKDMTADFAMFAYWFFTKPEELERLSSRYDRIKKKHSLVKGFYNAIEKPDGPWKTKKGLLESVYGLEILFDEAPPPDPDGTNPDDRDSIAGWWPVPENSRWEALSKLQIDLAKYKPDFIRENLRTIYVCRDLWFGGLEYGGTYDDKSKSIYVAAGHLGDNGVLRWLGGFHHEFSSILLKSYRAQLPEADWRKTNPADFEYAFSEPSGRNLTTGATSHIGDPNLYAKGFLCSYGTMAFEEDIDTYAQCFLARSETLDILAGKYPLIKRKKELLEKFYTAIGL